MTDEEIIEDLISEFYKRRPIEGDSDNALVTASTDLDSYCININGDKEPKTLGGASCMFMLDVNTPAKAHVGAMHWNKIDLMKQSSEREKNSLVALAIQGHFCAEYSVNQIREGECVRYASLREYFVLCCCYNKPELCAYSVANGTLATMEMNRKVWETNVKVRNPILADEVRTKAYGVKTTRWMYRDFLYSKPLQLGSGGEKISTGRNIPLWHCAVGQFIVYSRVPVSDSAALETIERKKLPLRTQYCISDILIELHDGTTESVFFEAAADLEGKCTTEEAVDCDLVGPECLNDLLYLSHVQAEYRCCCNRGNLCNHWGNGNPSKSEYQIGLTPEDFQKLYFPSNSCWRAFDFHYQQEIVIIDGISYDQSVTYRIARVEPIAGHLSCVILNVYPLRDQNCHRREQLHQSVTYQYFECECKMQALMIVNIYGTKTCDEKMEDYFRQYKDALKRPECYDLVGENGPVSIDMYALGKPTNFTTMLNKKVVTNSTPICVSYVKFMRRALSYGMYALRPATTAAELQHAKRLLTHTYSGITLFIQRCQSNLTTPCNSMCFIHLLPFAVREYARESKPSPNPRCFSANDLRRSTCETDYGCFDFHSVGGERHRGCIENIPELVEKNKKLAVLKQCTHVELWRARSYICSAVRDLSGARNIDGVLCCCRTTCPLRFLAFSAYFICANQKL
ncbi:unnamed protein product [Gongylonema pulchrum]|uniref:DNA-directed RNA polymerase n=1 Tax=Gongylonema pulchrum TaxID=637853 RepID=A0A183CV58_9BILA|nr:unnamed protein product [Gongylonema pulchrum]